MKRVSLLLLLFLFNSLYFSGCNNNLENLNSENNSVLDNLYFMKWNSYHAYYENENPIIQLNLLQSRTDLNQNDPLTFEKIILLTEDKEFYSDYLSLNEGSKGDKYTLYTLSLKMPKLEKGSYKIKKLKLIDGNNNEKTYDIGIWNIIVIEENKYDDLKVGKRTLLSGEFDWYLVELTKLVNKKICIEKLDFNLVGVTNDVGIKSSLDFNIKEILTDKPCLNANETKTFIFDFNNSNNLSDNLLFISLRPIVNYRVNNNVRTLILPTAIYSPSLNDKEINKILEQAKN